MVEWNVQFYKYSSRDGWLADFSPPHSTPSSQPTNQAKKKKQAHTHTPKEVQGMIVSLNLETNDVHK